MTPTPYKPLTYKKALIYVLGAALLWSSGGLLIKLVDWSGVALSGARSLVAALVLIALLGFPKGPFTKTQLMAACAYTATVILFVISNKYTTAANSILLQYTAPIYVMMLAPYVLGERNSRADFICIFSVLAGMTLFFIDDLAPGGFTGNILALTSGAFYGVMVVCMRADKSARPTDAVILGNFLSALIGIPFFASQEWNLSNLSGLLVLGIFQLGLSYYLYTLAIRTVRALDTVIISSIEPILNPLWVLLVIGEAPAKWAIVGGAVVVLSVTLKGVYAAKVHRLRKRHASQETAAGTTS